MWFLYPRYWAIGLFFFLSSISLFSANLIFDLDGVLLRKSTTSVFWEIGIRNLFGLYNPFNLETRVFAFLNHVEPRRADTPLAMRNDQLLPQILCDWLAGTQTNEQIRQFLQESISQHPTFFYSRAEQSIIQEILNMMFTPNRFCKTITHVKRGMKLIKRCFQQVDESGNRRHKIFILSNWDLESFEQLAKVNPKLQKILSYCDGLIISGEVHLIKPDPAIFECLFNQYAIDPDNELTIYIDDQECNIEAANTLNKRQFHAFVCKNFTFKPIKKALRELKVI